MGILIPQSTFSTSRTLRHAFCSGQAVSCLPRSESARVGSFLHKRIPSGIAICSGLRRKRDNSVAVQKGRKAVAREVKGSRGGINLLREEQGRERFVGVGVGGVGEETSEEKAGEKEEGEEKPQVEGAPLIGSMADLLNLEKQFAFYGAYHSNKLNILIHMMFVWPIFFTNGILWAYTPPIIPVPLPAGTLPLQQYMVLNVNFVIASIYALYYAALDKKAGSLGAAICLGCWIGSQAIAQAWPWSTAWKFVLIAQATCWTFQFIGHGIFEGRAPALLDNLPQAFLMAPFFVLLEFLQSFFGYEPYPGFMKVVEKKTEENRSLWRAGKGKKAA